MAYMGITHGYHFRRSRRLDELRTHIAHIGVLTSGGEANWQCFFSHRQEIFSPNVWGCPAFLLHSKSAPPTVPQLQGKDSDDLNNDIWSYAHKWPLILGYCNRTSNLAFTWLISPCCQSHSSVPPEVTQFAEDLLGELENDKVLWLC